MNPKILTNHKFSVELHILMQNNKFNKNHWNLSKNK